MAVMTKEELDQFLLDAFPLASKEMMGEVVSVEGMKVTMRLDFNEGQLRPGGTLSGPTMMSLADRVMYVAVAAQVGPQPMAVTSSLNINFLNRAEPAPLMAECELVKLGRTLAIGEVRLWSEGASRLCANASVTYSLVRTKVSGE